MKYYFLPYLLFVTFASNAQKTFSTKLELIKPTGKLDLKESYFQLSITNKTDSSYHIIKGTSESGETIHSFVETELQKDNGTTCKGLIIGLSPVDFNNKKIKRIAPKQTLSIKIPLFYRDTEGIIPMISASIDQIKKVRLHLKKFRYINGNSLNSPVKEEDLQSNWVTIDKEAFKRLLDENKKEAPPLFTIEGDSIKCNNKHIDPFYWNYQNESYSLEKSCSFSSQNKKYNYTITLSDYDVARGDGGCFRIIDIKIGNKTILQLNQSDGWDKIPEGIRNLSFQDYFLVEPLSDTVTAIIFCGYPYNSEPELLTIVILNKEIAKLVFNKNFIISEIKKTNNEFCLKLQDIVIEYTNDKPVKEAGVYRLWKENGILKFGGPYETMDQNVWAGEE